MNTILTVFSNADSTWMWIAKVLLYPLFVSIRFADYIYLEYYAAKMFGTVPMDEMHFFIQMITLWLILPILIRLYISIGKALVWIYRE